MKTEAIKITFIYTVAGLLWIYLSGQLFAYTSLSRYHEFETAKGFLFIIVTALLLFYLLKYFYKDQKKRIQILELHERELQISEKRYRMMFENGPLPKWIFDAETLQILDVNARAIRHYGYSKSEFLSMNIAAIRPEEDKQDFDAFIKQHYAPDADAYKKVRHVKASGDIIEVQIHSNPIDFKGKKAKVVTATDITQRESYIRRIERQNRTLKDISWKQCHLVRAPLSSMLGFATLLEYETLSEEDRAFVISNMITAAHQLDEVIKSVVRQADEQVEAGHKI